MTNGGKLVWVGRVLSGLVAAMLLMSGVMKLMGGPQLEEGLTHLGLPMSVVLPLAVVEITATVLYLVPQTSVLGAILLTGYLGGATCAHVRVEDPFFMPILIGIAVWIALALREPRLWKLVPLRL